MTYMQYSLIKCLLQAGNYNTIIRQYVNTQHGYRRKDTTPCTLQMTHTFSAMTFPTRSNRYQNHLLPDPLCISQKHFLLVRVKGITAPNFDVVEFKKKQLLQAAQVFIQFLIRILSSLFQVVMKTDRRLQVAFIGLCLLVNYVQAQGKDSLNLVHSKVIMKSFPFSLYLS